jgi:hypothetical protein
LHSVAIGERGDRLIKTFVRCGAQHGRTNMSALNTQIESIPLTPKQLDR